MTRELSKKLSRNSGCLEDLNFIYSNFTGLSKRRDALWDHPWHLSGQADFNYSPVAMSGNMVETEFAVSNYGKNFVKLLHVKKDGNTHYIKELEVCSALTLTNHRDYIYGDNSDIIATDSQKNTIYILAKQFGLRNVERFAMLLCDHFLRQYSHVMSSRVTIEEYPWKRIEMNGEKHSHAYLMVNDCSRVCEVTQTRNELPLVCSGIQDLRVLKTTQSAFVGFVDDEYRTLPDAPDRIFSTTVKCNWWYNTTRGVCFDRIWEQIKKIILEVFAGPADKGVYSASVQNTLYIAARTALATIPEIDKIELTLPNKHYFDVDFKRFPKLEFKETDSQIYQPVDKPSGNIHAVLERKKISKL